MNVTYSIVFQTPVPVVVDFPDEDTVVINPVLPDPGSNPTYDTTNLSDLTLSGNLSAVDVTGSGDLTAGDDLVIGDDATLDDEMTISAGGAIMHAAADGEGMLFSAEIATSYSVTTSSSIVLPANANVVDYSFIVTTAYNDSGTEVMNCGTAADQDKFVDDLDLTAGRNQAQDAADMQSDEAALGDIGTSNLTVNCVYTGQNGNASAGVGRFTIFWKLD